MGTRVIAPVHVAFRTYLLRRRPGCIFPHRNSPPRLYPCLRFTVSLAVAAQDSGPSGSLLLSRKNFPFSASCRFTPAHINPHRTQNSPGRNFERNLLRQLRLTIRYSLSVIRLYLAVQVGLQEAWHARVLIGASVSLLVCLFGPSRTA